MEECCYNRKGAPERALAKPGVKEAYDELEPAYQLACLRIASGLTQAELAEKAGVPQPNIARLESGKHQPTLELLRRVAEAISQVRRTRSKKSIAKL